MTNTARFFLLTTVIIVGTQYAGAWRADADFIQTNLVSDIPGFAALTDPNLQNPWGISHSPTSPFWVSDQRTNITTLYAVTAGNTVTKAAPAGTDGNIIIPQTASGPQGPTGQVFNSGMSSGDFKLANNNPATFIFANLNGTISAWNGGQQATIQATTPGAVYTGLAISTNPTQSRLYAANTAQGRIDVFNGSFQPVTLAAGAFATPAAAAGLVPFNVQNVGGNIYVTYAPPGPDAQRSATAGMGAVAIFDRDGNFMRTAAVGGPLASPWGITVAPASFGEFANDLLVGNFSFVASEINAFDPTTGMFEGTIPINIGSNSPGGLWALGFGTGGSNGSPDTLFFTDGINSERDGLFAALNVSVPGPVVGAGLPGLVMACGGLLALARRRRRQLAV